MTNREKFQALLRELFQSDCADLDFGIYRIMNYKRDVIEKFISTDLPELIGEGLNHDALADQSQAAAELAETAEEIAKKLGKDALDADGNLVQFQETEIGKKYLSLQAKAAGGRGREALEATIFNHLYTFFSRYYQDGDFISKRRYSKRQKYAIPYNGEEVYLHWANHDQYYVKTAEHFHDYTFTSQGVTVHFKLTAANVEQNNVKSDKRFFLPHVNELDWREQTNELVIPFVYRPLTEQEKVTDGTKNQQDKIIAEASEAIPRNLKKAHKALAAILAERRKGSDNQPVTFLKHHLRQYTRKNTSDFFIHKDLKGFLTRELDFYLKNEVLNLDEMEAAGEGRSEGWFQILRVIKAVGGRIIDFLDQIESFQKMLWEKRKFVTETQYCITVGTIEESFYPEIAACDAQWDEWKELFHIDEEQSDLFTSGNDKEERRVAFLRAHPTLMIDTKYYNRSFIDELLSSFVDLDSSTDGVLVHGENYQALRSLLEKYHNLVRCIYIDPPYNTGDDDFIYKDQYQSSSWLSFLSNTLPMARDYLHELGSMFASCDEHQFIELGYILRDTFGIENHTETITWNKRVPKNDKGIGNIHEYIYLMSKNAKARSDSDLSYITRKDGIEEIYELVAQCKRRGISLEDTRQELKKFYEKQGYDRGISLYCELDPNYELWGKVNMSWPNTKTTGPRYEVVNPVTEMPVPVPDNGWRWKEETFRAAEQNGPEFSLPDGSLMKGRIWYPARETQQTSSIKYLREVEAFLLRSILSLKSDGSIQLDNIELSGGLDYPKPPKLMESLFYSVNHSDGYFLDYFAGSGTSAEAVIRLNRQDAGTRKSIMIEMGKCFNTVLIPRVKKVSFAPDWKNGRPLNEPTKDEIDRSPRIIKYLRLESYEDALNNIIFDTGSGQGGLQFDDYLLKYMLKWETRKSETLLKVGQLAKPFSYKLTMAKGDETFDKTVDIPETFNYLLGLHVSTRKVYDDDGRRYLVYHGRIDHRRIAVIWRETEGWQKKDLERDKKFVAEQKLAEGADEVFVNGDSFIPNAKALEPVFKARMFAPVEA